jgi:hypothetical protein
VTAQEDTPLKKSSRKQPPDEEARLDQGIKDFFGRGPADYSPERWRLFREQVRLMILYPGKYVAHREYYEGEGDQLRLVKDEVLCVSRTLPGLHKRLAKLPQESQRGVCVSYVERHDALGYVPCGEPEALPIRQLIPRPEGVQIRYTCPNCGIQAWGRSGLRLECRDCGTLLQESTP